MHEFLQRVAPKRGAAKGHFKEDAAQAPHVRGDAWYSTVREQLGGEVGGRADGVGLRGFGAGGGDGAGDADISNLGPEGARAGRESPVAGERGRGASLDGAVFGEEEVLGFDISQQAGPAVQVRHPGHNVHTHRDDEVLWDKTIAGEQVAQGAARAVLHDHPQVVAGLVPVHKAHHVGVRHFVQDGDLRAHLGRRQVRRGGHRRHRAAP